MERPEQAGRREISTTQDDSLPSLSIISTGGTIASRIDYRTGAVTSQFDADDILRAIPGLSGIAKYRTTQLGPSLSENMTPAIWQELAAAVYKEIQEGATGVIVTHGTETMSDSSVSQFHGQYPGAGHICRLPEIGDRPSSDNTMNVLCSATAAVSPLGEVAVEDDASTSDDRCAVDRETRVRKMHTSRRDAFQSIGIAPLGYVDYPSLDIHLSPGAVRRGSLEPSIRPDSDESCRSAFFTRECHHPALPDAGGGARTRPRGHRPWSREHRLDTSPQNTGRRRDYD